MPRELIVARLRAAPALTQAAIGALDVGASWEEALSRALDGFPPPAR